MLSRTVASSHMTDDTPVCCHEVMTPKGNQGGYWLYECGGCTTVLAIDPDGLIYVIKEG